MTQTKQSKTQALIALDQGYWAQGLVIAGMDEAGRGPLAGPVLAGCVVLPPSPLLEGVNDSKKLSPKRRDALYEAILQTAIFARTGLATVEEIEKLNILEATKLAMVRAAQEAPCDAYLVDGNQRLDLDKPAHYIVGGDGASYHIAAASILAKVTRDRLILELDAAYPQYGFAQHKGYGTVAHIQALRKFGPCPAHRLSFLTKILGNVS